ncbi:MAG: mannose-1-phosphate guanylyltransferase, partial [Phycisphaerae bacterium]
MNYAVIMAGGTGKRLWPLSRKKRPKQILKILQGQTLLNQCCERLASMFDKRNMIILTNADYADIVRETSPCVMNQNVIPEPAVRDTAGAIGLAASILTKYDSDATMAVVAADHVIEPAEKFQAVMQDALTYVNDNPQCLVTFGIKPTFPNTQLGYFKCSSPSNYPNCKNKIFKVESFREKPDTATAEKYLADGNYLWNSGMFVWKARTILQKLDEFLPESTRPLQNIRAAWDGPNQNIALKEWFLKLPKISIDFAVMEKAENVHALMLDCRWLDLGSFAALADIIKSDENKNVVVADR